MKRKLRGFIVIVIAASLCLVMPKSFAMIDSMLAENSGIIRIHTYTTGVLKYNAAELFPRTGPGFEYEPEDGIDLKKGSEVRVLTISAKDDHLWGLVECETENSKLWTYLLYEDPALGRTIDIADIRKVRSEHEPNRSYNSCDYESDSVRKGPGYQYPEKVQKADYMSYPTVVATCQGWVLLEFEKDFDLIESDSTDSTKVSYTRGWVPLRAIVQY